LLIRRHIANGDLAYFTTWCPAGTSIKMLIGVEGRRWAIEDSFETAKNEFGLDHNETRSWHGWHRDVSLGHAHLCHDGCHSASSQQAGTKKKPRRT
jgi:SRSO17 transposase